MMPGQHNAQIGAGEKGTEFFDREMERQVLRYSGAQLRLRVVEGEEVLFDGVLDKPGFVYTFGASDGNAIVLKSRSGIVSRNHGQIVVQGSSCMLFDNNSTNGLRVNGIRRPRANVKPGDVVTIGKPDDGKACVMMLFSYDHSRWHHYSLAGKDSVTLGRVQGNDIVLALPAVSAHHATLERYSGGQWVITDRNSYNGVFVNGLPVARQAVVKPGDMVALANAHLVLHDNELLYNLKTDGVDIVARHLIRTCKSRGKDRVITDDVSLHIEPGEFVAIVGGSGAGKTTLLNELNGIVPATKGSVEINGIDLYTNYGLLKNSIGYVPQQDIVYDNLRLIDMLNYAAELRMPPDTTKAERRARAMEVLELLGLEHEVNNYVKSLSGGQRKRASIAVELLADPKLLFLDEPTSGLDPGIERNLMATLANMAHAGRTIVLVTHTTQSIELCDRVVMMGNGGRLCFSGDPKEACRHFGVKDFVDIYDCLSDRDQSRKWADEQRYTSRPMPDLPKDGGKPAVRLKKNPPFFAQLWTLSRRMTHLMVNDLQRLALLILQAPLLGWLIGLVGGDECFNVLESTQACLFAMCCAAFWMGILDSIQEICKERPILQREYAGGLNLFAYIISKVLVMGVLCLMQTALLLAAFVLVRGLPDETLFNPTVEMFVSNFMMSFSAMCLGLAVSALVKNSDRALALAPILIMPQVLFSGFLFELEGALDVFSNIIHCRWGMEALGTTVNLNALDLKVYENDMITPEIYEHEFDAAFDFTMAHLCSTWGVLGLFCAVCLVACGLLLRNGIRK